MAKDIQRPKVGLSVILMNFKDNSVLLGKRKGSHGAGTLAFPGGHIEWMESLTKCGEREMFEETELQRSCANYSWIDEDACAATNDFFPEENKHYITLFLRAKYNCGTPINAEPEKCEGWQWYQWEKLDKLGLFTPVRNLIKQGYNPFKQVP